MAGDEREDALDYIISVDIFSEGVDVPVDYQVIMLRPTVISNCFHSAIGAWTSKKQKKRIRCCFGFYWKL